MKKPLFLTTKSILIAFSLIAVCAFSTLLLRAQTSQETNDQLTGQTEAQSESQASHGRLRELQAQRLEGSWAIVVFPSVVPVRNVLGSFARGGVFIGSDRLAPFAGPQHGVWEHLGGDRFAYTFKQDQFDPMGNFVGILTVRVRLNLTGRDKLVGVAQGDVRDVNGNLIVDLGCGPIQGTRIKLELPSC